jgi:hypothetical protein
MDDDIEKIRESFRDSFTMTFPETADWEILAADSDGGCKRRYYLSESSVLFNTPEGQYFFASKRRYEYYERSYTPQDDYSEKSIYPVDEEQAKSYMTSMKHRFDL